MRRPIAFPPALLAAGLALALASCPKRAAAETWDRSFAITGTPSLVVHTNDGSVHVETVEGKTVGVHIVTKGWSIGSDGVAVDAQQSGNRIEITAKIPRWRYFSFGINRGLRIEVTLPKRADLQIETGDGGVSISPHTGTIRVHTGDGSISAEGLEGDVSLASGDGSIVATGLDGRLTAHTGDGHVRLGGRFDELQVTTGDGGVNLDAEPGSKLAEDWLVRTGDGSVELRIPSDLKARLDAHTGDGGITLDLPVEVSGQISRSTITGNLNGGGRPFVIRTGDGPIRIAAR